MTIITVLTCRLWSFQQLARAGERLSIRAGQLTLANWLKLASRLALTSTVYTFNNTNTAGACLELRIVFRLLTVRWRRIVIQQKKQTKAVPLFCYRGNSSKLHSLAGPPAAAAVHSFREKATGSTSNPRKPPLSFAVAMSFPSADSFRLASGSWVEY